MNSKSPLLLTTASLALAVVLSSCSGAALEKKATQVNALDNHLSIRGRVCTDPPDPSGFPVKVVMLVDQSGSMCISDPPGSQGTAGLCEQFATAVGIQTPARVRALQALTQQFAAQPNVQVTIVPWDTNVKNVWPPVATGQRFARPIGIDTYIANLQAQLGKGTDFQGALSYAYGVIASDIADTNTNNPQLLPRTRYVVVLLTDGTPYPRCSANDNLSQYADPTHP
ncbi:MAG TPA: vWA domain-containing protein, partial [Mycobacterium sp.]|nr:vWA domain-containing protein [Mycobacterium sp.]